LTFTVSSGNSATEASSEATNADYASTDAVALVTTSADAIALATQSAASKAVAANAVIAALTPQVTTLLTQLIARTALIAAILKKLKTK